LGLCALVIVVTIIVGLRLFYFQYSEGYKEPVSTESLESLVNINKLKSAIEDRNGMIDKEIPISKDPSI
jgi:hypothetical protein